MVGKDRMGVAMGWRALNPVLVRNLPSSGGRILNAWPQLHQLQTDRLQNAVKIVKHLVIGEAENDEALHRERGHARGVAGKLFVGRVGGAVVLNDEPCVE